MKKSNMVAIDPSATFAASFLEPRSRHSMGGEVNHTLTGVAIRLKSGTIWFFIHDLNAINGRIHVSHGAVRLATHK